MGRRLELAVLNRALDALRARTSRVVQVAGEPGVGKTRLLAELATQAESRGYLALRGRATEFERDLPFGMFVEALDDHFASLDLSDLERLGEELAAELPSVFPSLARQLGPRPAPLQEERYRAYRAVRVSLEALSASRPLVCTLDDIHWADPASEELLSYLLRHPPQGPMLLAVAFRPPQMSPRVQANLATATREGTAERIELCPLTYAEATEMLGAGSDRHAREIYRESGGNPFYLEQLARVAGHRPWAGGPALETLEEGSIPSAVGSALAEELRRLSRPALGLIEGASVAGDPFELETAASAGDMGIREGEALAALDELLEAGLIRSGDTPRSFRFRHPIVRRGIYHSLGNGWRIGAHARVAAALAARGVPAAVRGHHLERSARVGDEEAITSLIEAAQTTASGAPAIAARWYRAALRLLPEGHPEDPRKLALQIPLAGALCSSGQLPGGRAVLLEALEQLPQESMALRVRLIASCAGVEHLLGRHPEARARLLRGLEEVPDIASLEAAALKAELAVHGLYSPDYEQTCRWSREAYATARALEDHPLTATAAALLAFGECSQGHTHQAEPYLQEARSLLEGLGDAALATRLEASFYLGWAEHFMERFDDAIRHFQRGIATSRATGQGYLVLPMMLGLEHVLTARGRLREAGDLAEACLEAARLSGNAQYLSFAFFEQCWLTTRTGDLTTALTYGEDSLELACTLEERTLSSAASWALAGALLEAGQAERCRTLLLTALGGPELPQIPTPSRCLSYEMLTRADLALGRPDAAAGWARRAEAVARALGLPVATGAARRAQAEVLLASGEPGRASDLALAAAEAEQGAGALIEAARSRIVAGRALAEAGERLRGLEELERAEEALTACGAEGYRKRVVRELRRLGRRVAHRPGKSPSSGLASLTPREWEVAQLVTDGLTNREIADTLYLSIKTIERHLSNMLAKLGVPSRVAVAGLVARETKRFLSSLPA